nr:PREDICTED: proline-rich protein 11-like [Anolis carolinensis]|eukprot:XP_008123149.1 PREDICTED: proline-rich protein 11-like [Anolis carolinensis]
MCKSKRRQCQWRARRKYVMKRRKGMIQPQRPKVLPSEPTESPRTQNRPLCFRPSAVLSLTGAMKPLLTTATGCCLWCWKTVLQIFDVMKSSVFPSVAYRQELHTLRERLEKLETEFLRLQSLVQNGVAATSAETLACQGSGSPLLAFPGKTEVGFPGPVPLPSQPMVPPVPPPPPPPLPPPPPPPAPLCFRKTGGIKMQPQATSSKKDVPMQITLQDLLNVKLKKTQDGTGIDKKGSPFEQRKALVTVSDLQNINLKSKAPRPLVRVTNHLITPSKGALDFRKHLKKLAIKRSPGGTPLTDKENAETGTGLTPLMTQALRRKFQLAHPKSPSPAQLPNGGSFEEQS